MLTGRTDAECRVRAMALGVDAFMTKPFSVREVMARLQRLLEGIGYAAPPEIINPRSP